jgi:hypothetical protein
VTVQRRTRAVARARVPFGWVWPVLLIAGLAAIAAGAGLDQTALLVAGAAALGVVVGHDTQDPDRMYLEGFSDGIVYEAGLDPGDAGQRGRGHADAGRVPAGVGPVGPAGWDTGIDGGADEDQRGDPEPGSSGPRTGPHGAPEPDSRVPRQRYPAFAPDGEPISGIGEGPSRKGLPPIPAATVVASPIETGRAGTGGGKADRGGKGAG